MSDFFEAIQSGDTTRVAALLDGDSSLLRTRQNAITPLLMATYYGKSEVARLLMERGAEVSFGEACAVGDLRKVRTMLDRDPALLEQRSEDGYPPLGLAIFFRHPDVAKFLIERGADVNAAAQNKQRVAPVHAACAVQDYATLELLLARGADPNARQEMDYTPFHDAAGRGNIEIAKLLLTHGARTNLRAADGQTPADLAEKHGQGEFVTWLRSVS
jgi:ankyrin repeat protein